MTELQHPAYWHVLINHAPIIGAAAALAGLCVALLLRSRIALVPALAILVLAGVSAWPVYVTGENAYRPIMKIADDPGREWLDEHMERADRLTWIFFAMAGAALAALLAPLKWPGSAMPLGIAAAMAAMAAIAAGAWIAQAGGLVRHVEFRAAAQAPPAATNSSPHEH